MGLCSAAAATGRAAQDEGFAADVSVECPAGHPCHRMTEGQDMDVAALAQTILSSRTAAAYQDAQVSMLKKTMDTQKAAASQLLETMTLPLATDGNLGRNVNTYA